MRHQGIRKITTLLRTAAPEETTAEAFASIRYYITDLRREAGGSADECEFILGRIYDYWHDYVGNRGVKVPKAPSPRAKRDTLIQYCDAMDKAVNESERLRNSN